MTRYLISFPGEAMHVAPEELPAVADAAHAVVRDAREAGVLLFTGGLDDDVAPVRVAADGAVIDGGYPQNALLSGGFTVIDVPTREDAVEWASRIAEACRCEQELREFQFDPLV
jgi:hypothetical protein